MDEPDDGSRPSTGGLRDRLAARLSGLSECDIASRRRDRLSQVGCYVRRLGDAYATHQCSLMACACAYCLLLSLVPLLIVGVAGLGFFLGGRSQALHDVLEAIRGYTPQNAALATIAGNLLTRVLRDRHLIGIVGIVGLIYAGHQAFLAMQPAMNIIWGVPEDRHWFKQRLVAVGASLASMVLLGCNLAALALLAYLQRYVVPYLPSHVEGILARAALAIVPTIIVTVLFGLLYQVLPARAVPWRSAVRGALVAGVVWQLTLLGFGAYLSRAHSYDRLYGPLGGLVILVVWAYYSMVIFLAGAEIAADFEAKSLSADAAEARAHSGADLGAATGRGDKVDSSGPDVDLTHS